MSSAAVSPASPSPSVSSLPPIPAGFTFPFNYAFLTNADFFYLVPAARVAPFLNGSGLSPAVFQTPSGPFACVTYDFQLYGGTFTAGPANKNVATWCGPNSGPSASITQELELNIIAYPTAGPPPPQISFKDFVMGEDQSKLLGNHRVFVPCDNPFAIAAGEQCFGEPKFLTTFYTNLPSLNPSGTGTNSAEWGFQVNDPSVTPSPTAPIFTVYADLKGLPSLPSNPSPITEYGTYQPENAMIGCRWNLLQPMNTYFFDASPSVKSPVSLTIGASSHPMASAMRALIGDLNPSAARTFVSGSGAIQSRAFYPDNGTGSKGLKKFKETDRIQLVSFKAQKPENQKDLLSTWTAYGAFVGQREVPSLVNSYGVYAPTVNDFSKDGTQPDQTVEVVGFESYTSQQSYDAHQATQESRDFLQKMTQWAPAATNITVTLLEPVYTFGLFTRGRAVEEAIRQAGIQPYSGFFRITVPTAADVDTLLASLSKLAEQVVANEPNTLTYRVHRVLDNAGKRTNTIICQERYKSKADLDNVHMKSPQMDSFQKTLAGIKGADLDGRNYLDQQAGYWGPK